MAEPAICTCRECGAARVAEAIAGCGDVDQLALPFAGQLASFESASTPMAALS